jgi:hypothetical protein
VNISDDGIFSYGIDGKPTAHQEVAMLYIVQAQIDPDTGAEVEGDPDRMQSVLGV